MDPRRHLFLSSSITNHTSPTTCRHERALAELAQHRSAAGLPAQPDFDLEQQLSEELQQLQVSHSQLLRGCQALAGQAMQLSATAGLDGGSGFQVSQLQQPSSSDRAEAAGAPEVTMATAASSLLAEAETALKSVQAQWDQAQRIRGAERQELQLLRETQLLQQLQGTLGQQADC